MQSRFGRHVLPESRFALTSLTSLIRQCLGAGLAVVAVGATAQTTPPKALGEVEVSGQSEAIGGLQKTYSGGQFARGGDLGILGRTDLMDVPFSTTNYTSELINNQQGRTIADVVMNDASVRTLQARGGYGDDFQIRGFTVGSRDTSINGLYGLSPATRVPLEIIERVEVLKGPGSLTNGVGPSQSIGGAINVVTKRADDAPLNRVTATYMGERQFGTAVDIGRRFGQDNQWGVRANAAYRNGEGNIDNGRERVSLGSLGVDYAGARLRWSGDLFYVDNKTTNFRPQSAFLAGITQLPAVPDSRSTFYPGAVLSDESKTAITRAEYDITDSTTVYGALGYTDGSSDQNFPTAVSRINSQGLFTVRNGYYDEYNKTTSGDLGVRTKFKTGDIGHTVVLGANLMQRETGFFYQLTTPATGIPSSIYNPSPLPAINFQRGSPSKTAELEQYSVALADTMSFFDDRFLVTAGLRDQTINQKSVNGSVGYKDSAVTPLLGLVFKPIRDTSVYYNYTAGLQAGGIAGPSTANAGQVFAPQKSKQHEVGLKRDWGSLITQVAYYEIERPTSTTENNVYSFGGKQRNRGLELSAYGEVTRGLRAMASASFNDATLVRTANGLNQGNDANGVPERTFNVGLDWDIPGVEGLSVNGRVINTSAMWYDAANRLRMPSWTRVDIGARYATKVAGKSVVFRANLENVADRAYWVTASGYATVGAPRTLMLSAQMDF
ncbi:TonB-dependent siderophore receptor [Pigmentiphaga aceris]|uniref:TonB-dependent siderophore receptor n=1 Tax=Pigmentiphaga aceris TaxID=1940612 RepID=A0A5C0ARU1_9BURK|nr:TonB-dependent siderophore receptor [Pigmentiphaga aceris]QEI04879.1 TonB-dependent siderophore receptor [Pigmentiphaga aceris]